MLLLLLTLTVALVSADTCSFPLSGEGSCTYSSVYLTGQPTVTYVDDLTNPSCLDINYVTSSSGYYEFTYNIQDGYHLVLSTSTLLTLRSVYTGCSAAYTPTVFLVALFYGLSVMLGYDVNVKRGLFIFGLLAVLPIAHSVCSPSPSTITIGVPATYTCPDECTTCTSAYTCTGCKDNYYLAGSQCFTDCVPACDGSKRCVEGHCVGTGSLFFSIAWQFNGDGDIYVTTPAGNTISFSYKTADGGELDYDDQTGRGPENVFWSSSPPAGTYLVCIDDYEGANVPFQIPQTVTYYLNSATAQTKVISQSVSGLYNPSSSEGNPCTTTSAGYLGSYTV